MTIRKTERYELDKILEFYERCGYGGGALPTDIIICAEEDERIIGVVRLTLEDGVTMLRGMQVDNAFHGRGIGRSLLQHFETLLDNQACYCIPFRHLESFYDSIGFKKIDNHNAPKHLIDRLAKYTKSGLDMIIMKR